MLAKEYRAAADVVNPPPPARMPELTQTLLGEINPVELSARLAAMAAVVESGESMPKRSDFPDMSDPMVREFADGSF